MKKILGIILFVSITTQFYAQNEGDVLNLSQYMAGGTARGLSLSGAFGALGGDITSLSINPAGIGVYRSSEFVFTPTFSVINTTSKYHGYETSDVLNKLNIGNIGFVFNSNTNKDIGWVSTSFSVAYNRLIDFNKNITIYNPKSSSSYLDEFATYLNDGNPSEYYEDLAYNTYSLFYANDTNLYLNDMMDIKKYGQNLRRTNTLKGGVGEFAFSFGGNYSNMLYLGATIGVQSVYYSEKKYHEEWNIPSDFLNSFIFNDEFSYKGVGYNLKLGAIFKPINLLRLGVAFHTPTIYILSSEFGTDMSTNFTNSPPDDVNGNTSYQSYSPWLNYNFTVTSPMKLILSGALQSNIGFISGDFELVDYSASRISSQDDPFSDINQNIKDIYKSTYNLKIGGELKIENFALRAGYGAYGSPYKANQLNANATTNTYSLGFGIRGENTYIDFGYIAFITKYTNRLYSYALDQNNISNSFVDEISDIEQKTNKFVLTIGFRF